MSDIFETEFQRLQPTQSLNLFIFRSKKFVHTKSFVISKNLGFLNPVLSAVFSIFNKTNHCSTSTENWCSWISYFPILSSSEHGGTKIAFFQTVWQSFDTFNDLKNFCVRCCNQAIAYISYVSNSQINSFSNLCFLIFHRNMTIMFLLVIA